MGVNGVSPPPLCGILGEKNSLSANSARQQNDNCGSVYTDPTTVGSVYTEAIN